MQDAYEVLAADHREVEHLLERYRAEGDEAVVREFVELFTVHAEAEEQVLYPEVRRLVDGGDDLADISEQEHAAVRSLIARVQDSPPGDLHELVEAIADRIAEHVTREENVVFAAMRDAGVDADGLGRRIEAAEGEAPSRSSGNVG